MAVVYGGAWRLTAQTAVGLRRGQSSVKKRAGFNLDELSPIDHAAGCFIPCLFATGAQVCPLTLPLSGAASSLALPLFLFLSLPLSPSLPPFFSLTLFATGAQDDFIDPHHSQDIFDQYAGDKPGQVLRVRSHCRFRNKGTEYLSKSDMIWMNGTTKRHCDRTLQVLRFEGDHNSRRPQFLHDSASVFLCNALYAGAAGSAGGPPAMPADDAAPR
jgi:hypothetical protein